MNLQEAQREIEGLRTQARDIQRALADPMTMIEIGRAHWARWEAMQLRDLGKINDSIGALRAHIRSLKQERAKARQTRLIRRQESLRAHPEPLLCILSECFDLLRSLQAEGVELGESETALVDHIGVILREKLMRVEHE